MSDENRYARDWNQYSRNWDAQYGKNHQHLGDEWNAVGAGRKRQDFFLATLVGPLIRPDATVLEIGPGGAKWTVHLAKHAAKLFVLDVAREMLDRTEQRCR